MKNLVSTFKKNVSKTKQHFNHISTKAVIATSVALASSGVLADSPQQSRDLLKPMLDAIDVASIKSGLLSAGGIMIGLAVVVMAIRKVKSMLSH
ncbi:hypothetical protein ACWX9T_03160 [Pasteurella multocida]|uniref:hypothetical protein n=1 Tax=Pasteurella multocida TaxID=747 RepID=UPI000C179769|nr:hypothetical protein [Pasteurella multocida]MCW4598675.1 hypothetical protein [Pasteurella multocida subsp. multocida]NNI15153.1 hypothetical protein [Pasteurella multocida]NNI15162.1 hypothetical protein [Pasteurella multocida]NNI58747.1 hypothetical protein [Pasteurella multocida]HDR1514890.1 hypothetical protein [Pasteurella multocida]